MVKEISIVTIVCNDSNHIEDTILSVISQEGVNVEYIIVDGGSTDGTLDIINKYKSHIDVLISEPDKGIYDALNKGISLASKSLIGLIHSGDSYTMNALIHVYNAFKKYNVDIVYGDIEVQEGPLTRNCSKRLKGNHELLRKQMSIFHPSTFVSKNCYTKYGFYDVKMLIAADYELFLRYYLQGVTFKYLPIILASFKTGGVSETNTWQLVKEVVLIKNRYLGSLNAIVYFLNRMSSYYFYYSRKYIISKIIGNHNYNKLKNIKHNLYND